MPQNWTHTGRLPDACILCVQDVFRQKHNGWNIGSGFFRFHCSTHPLTSHGLYTGMGNWESPTALFFYWTFFLYCPISECKSFYPLLYSLYSFVQIVSFLLPPWATSNISVISNPLFFPSPFEFHPKERHTPPRFRILAILSLQSFQYFIFATFTFSFSFPNEW